MIVKRFISVAIVLSVVLMLAACGATGARQSQPAIEPDPQLAAQCLLTMIQAETIEGVKACLTEDSQDRAQEMKTHYVVTDVTVEAKFECAYKDYEIFSYVVKTADGETWEDGAAMFLRDENGYKLCVNADKQSQLVKDMQCKLCSGGGMIVVGNSSVCGICGGTGTQYYPNVYYDATLNTWMGQYMACSGCAGSGTIGAGGSVTCTACGGAGILFR